MSDKQLIKQRPQIIRVGEFGMGLMEIIVGVLIAAIIGFIALHLVNLGLAMYKLSSGANSVAEKLENAKQMAINQNQEVSVIFDSKDNLFGIDRNNNGRLESVETEEMPDGISISQDGLVIFSRNGKLNKNSKEPSIVVRNSRDSKRVNVSAAGIIEIE
ncbi:MAG: GspH/FimT family pseudopilin [Acidobacteriota bacterium]